MAAVNTRSTLVVTGALLEHNPRPDSTVLVYLCGLLDDDERGLIAVPTALPRWAWDGRVFTANLSSSVEYFSQLLEDPSALDDFTASPSRGKSAAEIRDDMARFFEGDRR